MTTEPYTRTPNAIYDAMPDMKDAELRVSMAIVRMTAGWQKSSAVISYSEFQQITGLSRQSVTNGIEDALRRGLITRTPEGQGFRYRVADVSTSLKNRLVNEIDRTSQKIRPEVVNELDQLPEAIKETERKQERKTAGALPTLAVSAQVGFCSVDGGTETDTRSDLPPRYDRPLAIAEFERIVARPVTSEESRDLKRFHEHADEALILEAFSGLSNALKAGTRIRAPVAYARRILTDLLDDTASPQRAFGLQRKGTHYAARIQPTGADDEQPDPEYLAEFIAANRKIDAEAARRRL